jgi:MFS family permease
MTALSVSQAEDHTQTNHPLALRMCFIAFLSYNISLGCMFGPYGLLVGAVEAKMGVGRELSTLGLPLVMMGTAAMAPVAGILAGKFSLRLLMLAGALMHLLGYILLALSSSMLLNLAVYLLLMGPGLAFTAIVLPTTLMTRWYAVNRGRALGFITMPLGVALTPLIAAFVLKTYGLSATYCLLAVFLALLLVPLFLIVDYPPVKVDSNGEAAATEAPAHSATPALDLLGNGRLWALALASAAISASTMMQTTHLVPMLEDWGIGATKAATAISVSALAGMGGSLIFGWLGDRLGGAQAQALLCFDTAILWGMMLLHPPFAVIVLIVALLGTHGAANITAFSLALSQQFGQAQFSRAFGLGYLLSLPFAFSAVPIAALMYKSTGTYAGALIVTIAFLLLTAVIAVMARIPNPKPALA